MASAATPWTSAAGRRTQASASPPTAVEPAISHATIGGFE
jgi:hypothetical protein